MDITLPFQIVPQRTGSAADIQNTTGVFRNQGLNIRSRKLKVIDGFAERDRSLSFLRTRLIEKPFHTMQICMVVTHVLQTGLRNLLAKLRIGQQTINRLKHLLLITIRQQMPARFEQLFQPVVIDSIGNQRNGM